MRAIDGDAMTNKDGNLNVEEGTEEVFIGDLKHMIDLHPIIESEPQWIPCSERLPEHSCQTLVTTKWDTEYSVECGFYWGENRWGTITNNVIAWMPLPEPYQGD